MLVRDPLSAYYYIAQADERTLAVAFINKLCWFESHYRHIFIYLYTSAHFLPWNELLQPQSDEVFQPQS